jgi:signal transduction histidine kinase
VINKKYFTAVKILFYGILAINLLLILFSIHRNGADILIFSQFTFILFIGVARLLLKSTFSAFFKDLFVMIEQMIDREFSPSYDMTDDTYISQIYHQMNRLYDIVQMQQKSIEREKNKVQSFVSDISHQLKTPLTNMHLLQETIKEPGISPKEKRGALERQEKQLAKIDFLIGALLKTSQLENGLIQIHPKKASIGNTILSALEGVLVPAQKKEIAVYYDNTTDYAVLHDSKWTSEALFNVMENAVKYTPRKGKLTILLSRTEEYVKISIKDTGIGIPRDDLPHIFTRFWRGDTDILEGNGIGLYLSRQIITLQHGYILVNSAVNCGSEFEIFMPL